MEPVSYFNMEIIYFAQAYSFLFFFMLPLKFHDNRAIQWNFCIFPFSSGQLVSFLSKQKAKVYLSL